MLPQTQKAVNSHDGNNSQTVNGVNGQREKLTLSDGQVAVFTLVYDQPQRGWHDKRQWIRFTIRTTDDVERSWFVDAATEQAVCDCMGARKGSTIEATKSNGSLTLLVSDERGSRGCVVTKEKTHVFSRAELEALKDHKQQNSNGHSREHTDSDGNGTKTNGYRAAWKSEEAQVERAETLAQLCDGEEWADMLRRYGKLYRAALLVSTEAWMETGTGFQPQQIGASATTLFLRVVETLQAKDAQPQPHPQPTPPTKGNGKVTAKAKARA